MTDPLLKLTGAAGTGVFTPDEVRDLIAKTAVRFPQTGKPSGRSQYKTALDAAYAALPGLYTKPWPECTAIEKAVQLSTHDLFPSEREQVAAELAKQFPESREAIRKELRMPTTQVRKTAHPQQPLSKATKTATAPMVAIYDADGTLVGCIPQDAITPVTQSKAPAGNKPAAQPGQTEKGMSLGTPGQQLGGKKPGPAAGVPVAPAEPIEDDDTQVVAKTRAGDFQGAARILKSRIEKSHDAREQAEASNTLQHLAVAEFNRMRSAGQIFGRR